jgi:hypothetical protein
MLFKMLLWENGSFSNVDLKKRAIVLTMALLVIVGTLLSGIHGGNRSLDNA